MLCHRAASHSKRTKLSTLFHIHELTDAHDWQYALRVWVIWHPWTFISVLMTQWVLFCCATQDPPHTHTLLNNRYYQKQFYRHFVRGNHGNNSLTWYEEESRRGTRLKRELGGRIINYISFLFYNCQDVQTLGNLDGAMNNIWKCVTVQKLEADGDGDQN